MKKKLSICAILTFFATMVIYIINKTICYLATIDSILNKSDGNYYEWRFGKIFYKKQGEGKPILLIHDLNVQSSGYEWKKVAVHLAEHNTVYTIDLLGCGRSEKPNITYTNYLYVQIINDFIKNIIGEKTDIIATGESASFAIMACNSGNDLIDKIAMINPLSLSELAKIPTKRTKTLKFVIQIPIIGTLLYNILQSKKYIEETFQTKYFDNPCRIDDLMVKAYYESAHTDRAQSKYLFASMKGRYTKSNIFHFIGNLTNSIYIISGGKEFNNIEIAEQYKKYVPAIETCVIDDTKHLPQLEAPREFIEQIQLFFTTE